MRKEYIKPEAEMMKFVEEEEIMTITDPSTIMTFGTYDEIDTDLGLNWKH